MEQRDPKSIYKEMIEAELKIINERIPKIERTIIMLEDILKKFKDNQKQFQNLLDGKA
ncbi:hypothetical protein [Pseudoalteromonas sp. JC28]|uniref:hypothetical protein n=1 Tax=Pseudoalteromonas sp. JC28 TaxID=2267617 RepID=UPI00157308E9|nr:hypothetical protein [Pseudoalteromonas sp. JC28]